MKHTIFLILFGLFLASCDQPTTEPEQPAPAASEAINEAGEPLGAAIPSYYVGYHLTRAAGAITQTGGIWVETLAWIPVPAGKTPDPELLMRDLITALDRAGMLAGVDLTKQKANWLEVIASSASLRTFMVTDSRDLKPLVPVPK